MKYNKKSDVPRHAPRHGRRHPPLSVHDMLRDTGGDMVHSGAGLEVEVVGRVYLRRDVFERRVSGGVYFELRIPSKAEFSLI
jgi:hypothetical protein